jgi:hypothetical protein
LIENHILIVLVDRRDVHGTGNRDVSLVSQVADPVDSLSGRKVSELNMVGEHRQFLVIE